VTRWAAFRGKGRLPTLRARFCVPCNAERPFRGLRCLTCGQKEPRLSKYGNVPTTVDGVRFHAGGEAARWGELQWLEKGGVISDLRRQEPFDLAVNGVHVTEYRADFTYLEAGRTVRTVEDWKGAPQTDPVYQLKRRLLLALHGIAIKETGPGRDRPRYQKRRVKA
jgi:hypothetical protein